MATGICPCGDGVQDVEEGLTEAAASARIDAIVRYLRASRIETH
jgi:hypothetical protein